MTPTPQRKNSGSPKSLQLNKLAELVGGELVGDASVTITGVAGIREAGPGEITFLANPKYGPLLDQTRASAVITFQDTVSRKKSLVRTANPSLAFSKVISYFTPSKPERAEGVHASAVVDPSARIGRGVSVGPHAVIGKNTRIGDGTVVEANCFIGADCALGSGTWIYPNVTIREGTEIGNNVIIHSGTVIGSDGFGYETVDGAHVKIPQTGSVKIEDDVEIGANVCVDRGRFQKTWIKKGTKIDNLVQVAHNVVIGADCLIVSQTGISGSTELGKNVIIAGQAGIIGHIKLEDGVIVGARAGVNKSVDANTVVLGEPARPIMEQKKIFALIGRLPELFSDLLQIKKKLGLK